MTAVNRGVQMFLIVNCILLFRIILIYQIIFLFICHSHLNTILCMSYFYFYLFILLAKVPFRL